MFCSLLSDCELMNISPSGQILTSSFVPVSRLSASSRSFKLSFFLSFQWIIIRNGCIYCYEDLCFLETISRGVVSSCWWMLANRRCQTQSSLSFITPFKDVPQGIETRALPPLHSGKKWFVLLQQLCPEIRWWRERTSLTTDFSE